MLWFSINGASAHVRVTHATSSNAPIYHHKVLLRNKAKSSSVQS